nr:MAG TPA: hypothetical protein [Caudoviricetes sp.]
MNKSLYSYYQLFLEKNYLTSQCHIHSGQNYNDSFPIHSPIPLLTFQFLYKQSH